MAKYIHIPVSFISSKETKELLGQFGSMAPVNVVRLWSFVADNHPSGVLIGMDKAAIGAALDMEEGAEAFVEALVRLGFLGVRDGQFYACNWSRIWRGGN